MTTFWVNKCVWQYIEDERKGGDIELVGRYMSMSVTPEQAIAATLGNVDLLAENAKLRELVKDMWPHVRHRSRMCGKCDLPCDTSDECLLYEPMRQCMRELGIEVT
jgi:hypothetical protein